jgi:hypothetical protein
MCQVVGALEIFVVYHPPRASTLVRQKFLGFGMRKWSQTRLYVCERLPKLVPLRGLTTLTVAVIGFRGATPTRSPLVGQSR